MAVTPSKSAMNRDGFICALCVSNCTMSEHVVFLALCELTNFSDEKGVSEEAIMEYCNRELLDLTLEDIHLRLAFGMSERRDKNDTYRC